MPLHVDGARLFNAAVALGTPARELLAQRRLGHLLPVQGPRLPGRVGGGRVARLHLAGAPRAQAAGRRDAPGGRAGGARPDRAAGRAGGHDRAPRRRPRNARRLADGLAAIPASAASTRRACAPTSSSSGCADRARVPRRPGARGRADGAYPGGTVRAVTHYGIERRARRAGGRGRPPGCWRATPVRLDPRLNPPRRSPVNDQLAAIAVPVLATDGDRRARASSIPSTATALLEREPVLATYLGIHDQDHRLGDMSRAGRLERHRDRAAVPGGPRGASTRPGCRRPTASSASWPSWAPGGRCSTTRCTDSGSAG